MSRYAFFARGKGHGARSSIIALQDNVNLRQICGEFLLKKGDRLDYDFSVYEALSSSRGRNQLKGLEQREVIRVETVPKHGSANQRQADERLAAKRDARRRREAERRRREEEARLKAEAESKTSEPSPEEKKTSVPEVELESETSLPQQAQGESTSSADDAELSSLSSEETESSSGTEYTSQSLPDADPDKPGQQAAVDVDELRISLESQLTDIHGVSRRMANQILDLEKWDREAVDGVPYVKTDVVPQILEIVTPHKDVFGK